MKIKGREKSSCWKSSTDYNKVLCSRSNICKKRGRHYVNPENFLNYEMDNEMILEVLQDTNDGTRKYEHRQNNFYLHNLGKNIIVIGNRSRFKRLRNLLIKSKRCRLILFYLLFTTFIFILLFLYRKSTMQTYRLINRDIFSILDLRPHKCYYPKLNPFDLEIMKLISTDGNHTFGNCSWDINGVNTSFIANHQYLIKTAELRGKNFDSSNNVYEETPTCCYQPFYRTNDVKNWLSPNCIKITENVTKITEEFIKLFCKMPVFNKDYYDMFALIPEKQEVEARIAKIVKEKEREKKTPHDNSDPNQLSVIIFGMDSVSHMNFIRLMRKTHRYLVKQLHTIQLNGYTKVAENTLPNVIPLLSGISLAEFKKLCVNDERKGRDVTRFQQLGPFGMGIGPEFPYIEKKVNLDKCPFIWNEFSSQGYRTSFAEDQNTIGIFNMYWAEAFVQQPTDYYLRTLTRQMEIVFGPGHCQGSRLSFKILLDNVINMAEAFKNRLYFQFTWSTRLSHDHTGYIQYGDDDLLKTIKKLNQSGHLNNSVLIIMSDHGSRSDKIRQTQQGQMEDRMPLAYIRVPDWFHKKFPLAMKNLKKNSDRLTTPYEIHHTLHEFMNLNGLLDNEIKQRSTSLLHEYESQKKNWQKTIAKHQSLFLEIPEDRSCFQAQIPLHWCLCHLKEPVLNFQEDGQVYSAVDFTINFLNKFLSAKSEKCAHLRLKLILNALKWKDEKIQGSKTEIRSHRDTIVEMSLQSKIFNQNSTTTLKKFEVESGGNIIYEQEEVLILEISFITEPGEASFEATVVKLPNDGTWSLTERVVRTNSYGDQSDCIEDHDIKEYCYCEPLDYLI